MLQQTASARSRCIDVVPAILVMLLQSANKLPIVPQQPNRSAIGFRLAGLTEMERYTWVAQWCGDRVDQNGFRNVAGLSAFRDDYDFHTTSDVREIVHLVGSRRAVMMLMKWIIADANQKHRRVIGSFDKKNAALVNALLTFGGITRLVMEQA